MKRNECGLSADHISEHDRAELDKFAAYVVRRAEQPKESERQAYAAVYGEVVFDASTPPSSTPPGEAKT